MLERVPLRITEGDLASTHGPVTNLGLFQSADAPRTEPSATNSMNTY